MGLTAFLIIFVSVFLHAGWNFLSKASRISISYHLVANGSVALLLLPVLLHAPIKWGAVDHSFWWLLLGSCISETIYCTGLLNAYKRENISIVYPMARALPVLMVPMVTGIFGLGKPMPAFAIFALVIVMLGCILLPQKSLAKLDWRSLVSPGMIPIFFAAAGTTGYTIVDSVAIGVLKKQALCGAFELSCVYYATILLLHSAMLGFLVLLFPEERKEFCSYSIRSFSPYCCGLASTGAYLLVLMAMPMVTNISYLQAFRQMSLPLGMLAGVVFLKEKFGWPKAVGIVLIISGLVMLVL